MTSPRRSPSRRVQPGAYSRSGLVGIRVLTAIVLGILVAHALLTLCALNFIPDNFN